jgi:hypothetical protein
MLGLAFQRESLGFFLARVCDYKTCSPKIKKPGVERRAQPPFLSVAPREARQSLPCTRRCLTLGSDYCPADPTVNPLISSADLGIPRTICNYTESRGDVKPLARFFLRIFLRVWKRRKTQSFDELEPSKRLREYEIYWFCAWGFGAFFLRASAVHGGTTPMARE